MQRAVKSASSDDAVALARAAVRRTERIDAAVAVALLVLLIFGWAIKLTPFDTWPRGDFLVAGNARHA